MGIEAQDSFTNTDDGIVVVRSAPTGLTESAGTASQGCVRCGGLPLGYFQILPTGDCSRNSLKFA